MKIENNSTPNSNSEGNHPRFLTFRVLVLTFIILCLSAYSVYFYFNQKKLSLVKSVSIAVATTTTSEFIPKKIEFGTDKPVDFPTNIPVEKGIKFQQSYSLDYPGQKQLTIVFWSVKTAKENYSLYSDFLKKQNWSILNIYQDAYTNPKRTSLYGTKENNDINVTINSNSSSIPMKSQVSISILKK